MLISGNNQLSPETKLLLSALRKALNWPHQQNIDHQLNPVETYDSKLLLNLAIRNGVEALLEAGWQPGNLPEWRVNLRAFLNQKRLRNLSLLGEFLQLQHRCQKAGIPILGFKGPILAHQLFGDVTKRSYCDLDILVEEENLDRLAELLQTSGYQARLISEFIENGDRYFLDVDRGFYIDLHSALTPSYYPIPIDYTKLWKEATSINLQGNSVLAFTPETLLVLLCIHGTKDNWQQLKWICDIAQLLTRFPSLDWNYIHELINDFRSRQALSLGLNLCEEVFGASDLIPNEFRSGFLQKRLIPHITNRFFASSIQLPNFLENLLFCWIRGHVYPFRRWLEEKVLPNENDKSWFREIRFLNQKSVFWILETLSFLIRPIRIIIKSKLSRKPLI
ncbi:MAG: nucleotidyltransferase family protein [Thermostichus sp. DG02_5_bins_236]